MSRFRNEEGSIALAVIVVFITSLSVLALVQSVEVGLRTTRRAGDSANALQVADAGINAAVQYVASVPSTQSAVTDQTGTVGDGTYVFNATRIDELTWNVTAVGTDARGLRRRVSAQAVTTPLFAHPVFINATATMTAGNILDSYQNETNRCTGLGFYTINDPTTLTFTGSGQGNANCTSSLVADWTYGIDGCKFPSSPDDINKPIPTKNKYGDDIVGVAKCPPAPHSKRVDLFTPSEVAAPSSSDVNKSLGSGAGVDASTNTFTCDATNKLQAGKVYYFDTIKLLDGCTIGNASAGVKPVALFAKDYIIGTKTGAAGQAVGMPQAPFCSANFNPKTSPAAQAYCPRWVNLLRLNVIGAGTVTFRNQVRYFWGVINGPAAELKLEPQQLEVWGAAVMNTINGGTQFSWHFDDSLGKSIGTGRYGVRAWREEAS